ncbi:hypothetical protein B0H17DRAFT_1183866 [Mycena rosella]|uniref:Uncharacterized protein n=1 Tax=Mycena rosella TaxID=1033263 RepID=A0AAD7CYC8_MYCRO|nr:hypothetical protein B0H17DRAFT_1183866 [Mycena rosella]
MLKGEAIACLPFTTTTTTMSSDVPTAKQIALGLHIDVRDLAFQHSPLQKRLDELNATHLHLISAFDALTTTHGALVEAYKTLVSRHDLLKSRYFAAHHWPFLIPVLTTIVADIPESSSGLRAITILGEILVSLPWNLQECLFPFAVRKDVMLSLCAHDPLKSEFSMSDASDNEDDLRLLRPINDNASRGELIDALKESQISVMKLHLYATSSKKQRRGADEDKLGYKSEVVRWAKRFLFTRALCINVTAFQAKPADTLDPTQPEDQFASEDAYVQSITVALYQEIPEKFHSLVDSAKYGSFASTFIHEFGEGRSSLLNVLRKALPVILNGANIDMSLLTTAGADRSNNAALTALLCFPNEQKPSLYPPLLFPGPTRQMMDIFTGPIVMKVHRLMYFGPKSLTEGSKPASNSNGVKFGLDEVTDSSVAASAILARFIVSTDKEWASKGAISGTGWEEEYRVYHKMLACGRNLPHVQKAFRTINKFVFSGLTPNATARNLDAADGTEDIAELLRQFELGVGPMSDPEEDEVVIAQPGPAPDEPVDVEDRAAVPAQVHAEEPLPVVPEGRPRRAQRVVAVPAVPAGRGRGARGAAKQRGGK